MQNETVLKLDVAALTDIGCKPTNNEDSFGYDLEARLFVVWDGMGGSNAGETASATAVRELVENFCRDGIADLSREKRLFRFILHANRVVVLGGNMTGACRALVDEAKRYGAVDNVTCLLVQVLEAEALDGAAA